MTAKGEEKFFGEMVWDKQLKWWSGKMGVLPGEDIEIYINCKKDDLDNVIVSARQIFDKVKSNQCKIKRKVAEVLLDIHNESWNDGEPTSESEFKEKIRLNSFAYWPDGDVELCYVDGGLFWGHTILVFLNNKGIVEDAKLMG